MSGLGPSVRSAQSLVPGDAPGKSPLKLGAITFNTSECPEDFPIGALRQMFTEHTLPGGTRILNKWGPSAKSVQWRGRLWAGNVKTRVAQLRLYAVSGQDVLLAWKNEQYLVFVSEFDPHYHNEWRAEYDITVQVVADRNGAFTIAQGLSIDQQVQGLQSMMIEQNNIVFQFDSTGAAAFQPEIVQVQQAVSEAGPLATTSQESVQTIGLSIDAALAKVQPYIAALQQLVPGAASALAPAMQLASVLANIKTSVNRGQQPQSQLAQGGDLFGIAAQHYGDPTKAFDLAAVNGLLSPWLTKARQTTITLPPLRGQKLS